MGETPTKGQPSSFSTPPSTPFAAPKPPSSLHSSSPASSISSSPGTSFNSFCCSEASLLFTLLLPSFFHIFLSRHLLQLLLLLRSLPPLYTPPPQLLPYLPLQAPP